MNQTTNDAATKTLLSVLENFANDWTYRLATVGPLDLEIQAALRGVVRRLTRSRKEFDSKLFILLVFGPLKSGKSTLVNCLVRSEVSPTALGISTTKRPCIILGANGSPHSAEQFFEVGRNPNTRLEAFENVIDHLRGLEDRTSMAHLVEAKGLEWAAVHNELRREQRDGAREPLITALRVCENSEERFLDEGVAVIDSPGLDDPVNLELHEKTAVDWAVANADLCVLVHSSLAAPGVNLLKFVASTLAKDSAPPLVILQNRFDARLWRKDEVIAAENDKQQQDTRAKVSAALEGSSQKVVFKEFQANLGLASDRRFRHEEVDKERQRSLGLQDKLEEVQDAILGLVKDNREPLKRANCVNRLKEFLKPGGNGQKALEQCKEAAQGVKERHQSEMAVLAGLVAQVQDFLQLPDRNGIVNAALKEQEQLWLKNRTREADGLKLRWCDKYGDGEPHINLNPVDLKLEFRKKIPGAEINKECQSLTEGLQKQLGAQVFGRDDSFGVNLGRMLSEELIRAEETVIPHVNKTLAALELAGVRSKPGVGTTELPNPRSVFESFKFQKVDEKTWLVFDERFNTKEAHSQVDKVAKQVETQMETFRDQYAERVRMTVGELAQKRKQELLAHLAAQTTALSERWQHSLRCAETALTLVDELGRDLGLVASSANAVDVSLVLAAPGR